MKVSIIIPIYNAERYIDDCLTSVLNQTYKDIEVIIVNDGSTDNSIVKAQKYESDKIRIFSQVNKGAATARNVGLSKANGNYIQFLDADDMLTPNKIFSQMKVFERLKYPEDVLMFGKWYVLGNTILPMGDNQKAVWHSYDRPIDILVDFASLQCCLPPMAYLTPKSLIMRSGLWNEQLSMNDDGDFFARVLQKANKLVFCNDSESYYRSTPNSLSKRMSSKAAISQIHSLIIVSTIMQMSEREDRNDAIYKMLSSCLCSFYPYYRKQRKIGELYIRKTCPDKNIKYPSLTWKMWVFYYYNLLFNCLLRDKK